MSSCSFKLGNEFPGLQKGLKNMIQSYTVIAENELINTANSLENDIMAEEQKEVEAEVCERIKNGFTITTNCNEQSIQAILTNSMTELSQIENGYELKNENGEKTDWIEGNHVVKDMVQNYSQNVMPTIVQNILDKIIKDCDLT